MATLPVSTRTWVIQPTLTTNSLATAELTVRQFLIDLVQHFITYGGCTIDYMLGSVLGVKGDGINRWTTTADVDLNGNSFAVLNLPHSMGQIMFTRDGGNTGNGSCFWSPVAGFTGGGPGVAPTAVDQQEITSETNFLPSTNANFIVSWWKCNDANKQGIRWCLQLAANPGVFSIVSIEKAVSLLPVSWSNPVICRWTSSAASGRGVRTFWHTTGWRAYINNVHRLVIGTGDQPQLSTTIDGDREAVPTMLSQSVLGTVGLVDDWWFVDASVVNMTTFTDAGGIRGKLNLDESLWPWNHTTSFGGSNVVNAYVKDNYLSPAAGGETTPPSITNIVPAINAQLRSDDVIQLDITDNLGSFRLLQLLVYFPDGSSAVIYKDGAFKDFRFVGAPNSVVGIPSGFRFFLRPVGDAGWTQRPIFDVDAIDTAGNRGVVV